MKADDEKGHAGLPLGWPWRFMQETRGNTEGFLRKYLVSLALLAAVLAGGALRLFNINWDEGHLFHPDERMILMTVGNLSLPWPPNWDLLLSPKSPLNPHFFAYGSLPLYLLKAAAHLLALRQPEMSDFEHIRLVGRAISGLFDTVLILLVFLLGKRLYNRRVGLLAATFVAFTVLHIQLSHFYTVDTLLTFFIALAMLWAVDVMRKGCLRASALLGVCTGLALATKVSVLPLALTVVAAWLLWLARGRWPASCVGEGTGGRGSKGTDEASIKPSRAITGIVLAGVLALMVFLLGEPYAVIDWDNFIKRVIDESNMVRGIADLPYTRQYINTPAYLYQIWHTSAWGLGIPLGIVAFGGLVWGTVHAALHRRNEELLLLSWTLVYFLINGSFLVKFLRYMLPIVPFLCILGAAGLFSLGDWLAQRRNRLAAAFWPVIAVLVLLPTVFYAIAFVNGVYGQRHPWLQISEWMYRHLPADAVIATEHWDDRLPVGMRIDNAHRSAEMYGHRDMRNYEEDNVAKLNWMIANLRDANVIVLASNRLYGSIARLPERYPLTTAYYQLLFSEELGFKLTAFAANYPTLFGITLMDDTLVDPPLPTPPLLAAHRPSPIVVNLGRADESFTVYDHPKPLVFQKVRQLSEQELRALLEPALRHAQQASQVPPPSQPKGSSEPGVGSRGKTLLLTEEERAIQEAGGTWREMFNPGDLTNRFPSITWWLVVELLGLVTFPMAFVIFRDLHDRGLFLSKTLGILLLAYPVWLAASLKALPYNRLTIAGMLLLLAAISAAIWWAKRQEIAAFLRQRYKLVVGAEALFLVAYLLFCFIRLLNPDLWQPWTGGEKPMEFAFLNAIIRSTYFPPYDPYYAGGTINYYYYGQYLVATLIKLTGIVPAVAFNLAVPMLFALTVTGVFGVALSLVKEDEGGGPLPGISRAAQGSSALIYLYPFLASLFVAVIGNLDGMVQLVDGLSRNSNIGFKSNIPGWEGLVRLVTGLLATVTQGRPLPAFDYWRSTRIIPGTINEFPFFSFLFADLHPHMIGIPFTVLVLGLALNLVLGSRHAGIAWSEARLWPLGAVCMTAYGFSSWLVLAIALGSLAAINSWDLPTYLGIIFCALLIRWGTNRAWGLEWGALPGLIVRFGAVAALSLLLYAPFFQRYQALYVGLDLTQYRTKLADYWQIFGFFLFILASFLVLEALHGQEAPFRWARLLLRRWEFLPRIIGLYRVFAASQGVTARRGRAAMAMWGWSGIALLLGLLLLTGQHLPALLLFLLILTVALAWRQGWSPEWLFTLLLAFAGLLISLGVEIFFIRDFLAGGDHQRMNTIFKFYIQVWVFLGIVSAVALSRLSRGTLRLLPARLHALWWTVFGFLLLSALIYPVLGTAARVNDRFPGARPPIGTFDGMAFMTVGSYTWEGHTIELQYDYDAIRWLLQNVDGSPVIAEAAIGYYREFGVRVASFTGLPTLLGMHQSEQRYDFQVGQRDGEARLFFSEPDYERVADLARKLHIKYIYVGQLERIVYPPAGLSKFDQAVGKYLDLVYENPKTRIYRVR